MNREIKLHDLIRSYDFVRHGKPGEPVCYLEGVVVGFSGIFIDFLILKRVWGEKEEPVGSAAKPFEFSRTPKLGASIFDAAELPRIEFLKESPPCFSLDADAEVAYKKFRAEMDSADWTDFHREHGGKPS